VYPNYDPLIALAAAAAVTSRIKLVTAILIMPYRTTAVMAKQIASVDRLSGGRVVLGVGLGGRGEDYQAAGVETKGRAAGARASRWRTSVAFGPARSAATPEASAPSRARRVVR